MSTEKEELIDVKTLIEKENPVICFHVAPYFRVSKSEGEKRKILASYGLSDHYDPVRTNSDIEEQLWEYKFVDGEGFFTFPPREFVLGHTAESIIIPPYLSLQMKNYFHLQGENSDLPLTTNISAPLLHPGSQGPQTYEIYNESEHPLKIDVSKLICDVEVFFHGPSLLAQEKIESGYKKQTRGEIKLGTPHEDWEVRMIRESLNQ